MFKFWVNNKFIKYQNFILKKKCILIFDRASSHINNEIISFLDSLLIDYIIIPPGFTRFLQPLDASVNKPFKMALKKVYLKLQQKRLNQIFENQFTITNKDIIEMISNIWYNENDIKEKVINNSFLFCGISQKMEGSKDEMFRWPDIEIDNKEDADISNILNDMGDNSEEEKVHLENNE